MDDKWAEAMNEELGTDLETNIDDTPDDTTEAEDTTEETQEEPQESEDTTEEYTTEESEDTSEESEYDDQEEEAETPAPETPAPEDKSQKELIKEALRELEKESGEATAVKSQLRDKVLERLYPEGIDRQLRDADGDPINGIDDLTKLINPETDDYFTEDEAGSWLLRNQQKLNQDIEKMERQAEAIAEMDINLRTSADRVEQLYGDFFRDNPEVYERITQAYNKTIVRDPQSGLVIDMPVEIEDFYEAALSGYMQAQDVQKQQAAAEAERKKKQQRSAQQERGDLSRFGSPTDNMSKDERGWAEAMNSYYES